MLLRRVARPMLSVAFIAQGVDALRNPAGTADAARYAAEHLPHRPGSSTGNLLANPERFALVNAAVQIGAGVLLATGKTPRIASAVLAATVIPGNLGAHMFWAEEDRSRKADKRRAFLTDISLLGGLIIAAADTGGRPSLGWRGRRAAERLTEAVASTMRDDTHSGLQDSELTKRLAHGLQSGAELAQELTSTAAEKSGPLLDAALTRGTEIAETAREKAAELAETARERGTELAQASRRTRAVQKRSHYPRIRLGQRS